MTRDAAIRTLIGAGPAGEDAAAEASGWWLVVSDCRLAGGGGAAQPAAMAPASASH